MSEEIIKVGQVAPEFTLEDQNEDEVSLQDFQGKKVLLSFHPLAWTGVCQNQMEDLENHYSHFEEYDTVPLGFSVDAGPSKAAWAEKLGLNNLSILADFWPHGEVAKKYGIFREKLGFSERANILVDESGRVIWTKVYPMKEVPDLTEVFEQIKNN